MQFGCVRRVSKSNIQGDQQIKLQKKLGEDVSSFAILCITGCTIKKELTMALFRISTFVPNCALLSQNLSQQVVLVVHKMLKWYGTFMSKDSCSTRRNV